MMERHIAWLNRKLGEHERIFKTVYPREWSVDEHISHEFCLISKRSRRLGLFLPDTRSLACLL